MIQLSTYAEIIKKKKKEWNCEGLMDGHNADRGQKLPFSSPLMNWATYGGIPRNKITEFFGDPGGGKAQPLYSKVLTPDGFINMGDVKLGTKVVTSSGNLGSVSQIFPQGKRDIYEIKLDDDSTIRVADNHLNLVWLYIGDPDPWVLETTSLIELFSKPATNVFYIYSIVGNKKAWRKIVDIKYIGKEECQCIMIDHPDHTYISDNFIPTHNTTTAVDICKNCIEIFNKEYSYKVDSLREQIASGNKSAVSELADLEDFGPKKVLYIDLEHSFDAAWSKTLGIDESDIDVMQPPDTTAEEIMQTILDIIETGEVGMIVLDSIPSLVPKMELEKNIGERTVSALAGPLSVFCRKVVSLLTRYQCTLLMINQVRDNMDNPYVVNTPGGKAPKFYSSLRIQFRIGAPVDFLGIEQPQKFESPAGYLIKAQIVKQKSAPWDRKQATYYLMCKSGIRPDFDYANLAINKYGVICKKAAWFTFTDPQTGEVLENESGMPVKVNGLARVYDYLKEHPDYYNKLKEYITNDINGASSDE